MRCQRYRVHLRVLQALLDHKHSALCTVRSGGPGQIVSRFVQNRFAV